LSEGFSAAIVGSAGDDWIASGVARLTAGEYDALALPEYGAAPHITQPRK
jgi:hypothetical protein